MRKIYAIAAFVVATGLTASAAIERASLAMQQPELRSLELTTATATGKSTDSFRASRPMKISSADDILGVYLGHAQISFGASRLPDWSATIIKGTAENEVILSEMFYINSCMCSPAGIVDPSASTLTISKQDMGIDSATGETLVFQPLELVEEKGGNVTAKRVNTLVLTIGEDGNMSSPAGGFSLEISQGSYMALGDISLTAPDYFVFNEWEWTSLGVGQYTDNALINFFEDATPVSVDCEYFTKGTEIVARNPYASGVWAGANPGIAAGETKGEGCIVFDVKYPGCVAMRPATGSGFVIDYGTAATPDWQEIYLFNTEGTRIYYEGMDPKNVELELLAGGSPVSTFNAETNTATLQNIMFSITSNPFGSYGFPEEKNAEGYVTKWKALTALCKIKDGMGVEGVEVAEEGAVKYFNMQGMEVVNPAKGQLVIKKQGNKAVKVVM